MKPTPEELAQRAGLVYVSDEQPGIRRRRCGQGFAYSWTCSGKRVSDSRHLRRIERLVIPPAWREVWITREPRGHLQVTGRDDRGRKQYIYHEDFSAASNRAKFDELLTLSEALPRLRRRVRRDLDAGCDRCPSVLAAMVAIVDATGIRIGNEEYAKDNGSFGLTTLERRHVCLEEGGLTFCFPGKSGQEQRLTLADPPVVRLVEHLRRRRRQPALFHYRDEAASNGRPRFAAVDAEMVNEYLRESSGIEMTAKDLRTWRGTVLVAGQFQTLGPLEDEKQRQDAVIAAIDAAAEQLGNTRAVCRDYYVHPALVEQFLSGQLAEHWRGFQPRRLKWFNKEEQALRRFLEMLD